MGRTLGSHPGQRRPPSRSTSSSYTTTPYTTPSYTTPYTPHYKEPWAGGKPTRVAADRTCYSMVPEHRADTRSIAAGR
ncbi:hypothetical protein NHX12_025873 [Muraenolepis orangiensis]|uniref:Uncharacterized protein n=1 Tax=Muraenolepis orangiensis TaxID=630683 RepID=A0A9Q0EE15_9TELE|nr:hypothetical protein NHX12_025873 [Muraenolepis orangiensis]